MHFKIFNLFFPTSPLNADQKRESQYNVLIELHFVVWTEKWEVPA